RPADSTPPTTSASYKNADNSSYTSGTWTHQNVTVTLSASDNAGGSGVANTFYKIDGGTQQTYSTPFTITTEADHTVTYWSVDNANNTEANHTDHVKIDKTAPVLSDQGATTSPNGAGWYSHDVSN